MRGNSYRPTLKNVSTTQTWVSSVVASSFWPKKKKSFGAGGVNKSYRYHLRKNSWVKPQHSNDDKASCVCVWVCLRERERERESERESERERQREWQRRWKVDYCTQCFCKLLITYLERCYVTFWPACPNPWYFLVSLPDPARVDPRIITVHPTFRWRQGICHHNTSHNTYDYMIISSVIMCE